MGGLSRVWGTALNVFQEVTHVLVAASGLPYYVTGNCLEGGPDFDSFDA